MGNESKSQKQALIGLKITKTDDNSPGPLVDERLLKRAMELHREIKKLSSENKKLQDEKLVLLEENRNLRIKVEKKEIGDYQDH